MTNHVAIALSLIAGLALGLVASATGSAPLKVLAQGVEPLGTAFVALIKMVVIPLIGSALFSGIAGSSSLRGLGRVGGGALIFFWSTTLIAIVFGMAVMYAFVPLTATSPDAVSAAGQVAAPELPSFLDFVLGMIPSNPFEAASKGELLPLVVFTLLFAAAGSTLPIHHKERLIALADAVTAVLIKLVFWILWIAPLGVFGLAAPVTARLGWAVLQSMGVFVVAVILGLAAFVALVYLPVVRVRGGMGPIRFIKACLGPQAIGFSTTSSMAAIPAMLKALEQDLGVPRTTSSVVVPIGAVLHRGGSTLFQGAAVIFLANFYGVPLTIGSVASAVVAIFVASLSVASVPSAGVLMLAPALGAVGIPLSALGVLLGIDRIPDMFRTAVNVAGDIAAAVAVSPDRNPRTGG